MASISQLKVNNTTYDIKATYDGGGNTIASTYLKLSGGTMTGNLTMGGASQIIIDHTSQTRAANTIYTVGTLKFKNADNSVVYSAP